MADIVLDANVLVGCLDENDSLHVRATALVNRVLAEGHRTLLLDFLIGEAVSVICRRAAQRKANPPDLAHTLRQVRRWRENGEIGFMGHDQERLFDSALQIVDESAGKLNFNDALLVALQREGSIGDVASFDAALDGAEGLRRIAG